MLCSSKIHHTHLAPKQSEDTAWKRAPIYPKSNGNIPRPPLMTYIPSGYVAAIQSHSSLQNKSGPALYDVRHVVLRRQFALRMISTMNSLHPLSDLFLRIGKAIRNGPTARTVNDPNKTQRSAKANLDAAHSSGFQNIMRALDGLSARNETHTALRQDDANAQLSPNKSPFVRMSEFASLISNRLKVSLTARERLLMQHFYGHTSESRSQPSTRKNSSGDKNSSNPYDKWVDGIMNYVVAMGAVLTARQQVILLRCCLHIYCNLANCKG